MLQNTSICQDCTGILNIYACARISLATPLMVDIWNLEPHNTNNPCVNIKTVYSICMIHPSFAYLNQMWGKHFMDQAVMMGGQWMDGGANLNASHGDKVRRNM